MCIDATCATVSPGYRDCSGTIWYVHTLEEATYPCYFENRTEAQTEAQSEAASVLPIGEERPVTTEVRATGDDYDQWGKGQPALFGGGVTNCSTSARAVG